MKTSRSLAWFAAWIVAGVTLTAPARGADIAYETKVHPCQSDPGDCRIDLVTRPPIRGSGIVPALRLVSLSNRVVANGPERVFIEYTLCVKNVTSEPMKRVAVELNFASVASNDRSADMPKFFVEFKSVAPGHRACRSGSTRARGVVNDLTVALPLPAAK